MSSALKRIFKVIEEEVTRNREFAEKLEAAIKSPALQKGRVKRQKAAFDPLEVFESGGENRLLETLQPLDIEQLRDIVAEFGMDAARLAMKWTSKDRLIKHIATTAASRAKKGDAFRT